MIHKPYQHTRLFSGLFSLSLLMGSTHVLANPATVDHPGRLLASNCFQCHGTDGYGMEHLAGKNAAKIVREMKEMSRKTLSRNIMNVHAVSYTPEEIQLIADYFSKQ